MKKATFEEVFTEAGIIPEWIERGIKLGIEKGIEQSIEKEKNTVRNLIAIGMPLEDIAKITETPVEKIKLIASQ